MKLSTFLSGVVLAASTVAAHAGAGDDAQRHFAAIAANDVDTLMANYADGATMYWNGGGLDGVYVGAAQLRELWKKFAANNGQLELAVARVQENANPKGATVTADARYRGKSQIKIRHVVVYRDGKIVSEVWQIDPAMQFATN